MISKKINCPPTILPHYTNGISKRPVPEVRREKICKETFKISLKPVRKKVIVEPEKSPVLTKSEEEYIRGEGETRGGSKGGHNIAPLGTHLSQKTLPPQKIPLKEDLKMTTNSGAPSPT